MMLSVREENFVQRWYDTVPYHEDKWRDLKEPERDIYRDFYQVLKGNVLEDLTQEKKDEIIEEYLESDAYNEDSNRVYKEGMDEGREELRNEVSLTLDRCEDSCSDADVDPTFFGFIDQLRGILQ